MGAGSYYSYRYFMLIDDNHPEFYDGDEWVDVYFQDFKETLCSEIGAEYSDRSSAYMGNEAYAIFETENVLYGIDTSGGLPCLFALPKALDDDYEERSDEEIYDSVYEEVRESFNKFIELYQDVFRYPTSAWTSEPYGNGKYYV